MILIGHPWVNSPKFIKVFGEEDIKKCEADDIVLLEPLVDAHTLACYCRENGIAFAIPVMLLQEAVLANAMGAKYMICEEGTALMIQPIAQEYLFDTRILVLIQEEKEIAKHARSFIDGVIFGEAIS